MREKGDLGFKVIKKPNYKIPEGEKSTAQGAALWLGKVTSQKSPERAKSKPMPGEIPDPGRAQKRPAGPETGTLPVTITHHP